MTSFRLEFNRQRIELDQGYVIIGRADDCVVVLDDLMVSRHHGRLQVDEDHVTLEDLNSRNGILVRGERIREPVKLGIGDTFEIGKTIFKLHPGRPTGQLLMTQAAPVRRLDGFGLIGELAEKALGLGRVDEAERLLLPVFEQITEEARSPTGVNSESLQRGTRLALKLLELSHRGVWFDYLVALYSPSNTPWPLEVVEELYQSVRQVKGADLAAFRAYSSKLRDRVDSLGPAERFQVGRIQGLERLVGAG